MSTIPKDGPDSDGIRSYNIAISAIREINIRKGWVLPSPDHPEERRWAKEGYHGLPVLDSVLPSPGIGTGRGG